MTKPLAVLIIEDEPLIAMMLEDFVDLLGHKVAGSADSVAGALGEVAAGGFDVAILDVHVEPPPAAHADAPQLAKPFTIDGVSAALKNLVRG